jgi:hypothetical protein
VAVQFQGTDAVYPGSKVPDMSPDKVNESTWTHELESLSGKQFIRYRIRFDVAKDTDLTTSNSKPQVNYMRLRFRY